MAKNNKKSRQLTGQLRSKRISGQAIDLNGALLRLFAATVAILSALYFVFGFDALHGAGSHARESGSKKCKPSVHWRARDNTGCSYAYTETNDAEISATDDAPGQEAARAAPQPVRVDGTRPESDRRRTIFARDLEPGITVAELCSVGKVAEQFRCRDVELDATSGATVSRNAAADTRVAGISGFVMTSGGDALAGIPVVAVPERIDADDGPDAATVRFWTTTDASGAYAFEGIPDGEYTIRSVNQAPYPAARTTARVGTEFANIVVTENLAAEARGQVLSAEGWPLEGVTVLPTLPGQPGVLTGPDGRFALPVRLKPSVRSFALRFQRPGFREYQARVALPLDVGQRRMDLDVVMVPVAAMTSVKGRLTSNNGAPLAGRIIELRQLGSRRMYQTRTDAGGGFEFPVVEASSEYRLIAFGGNDHKDLEQRVYVSTDGHEYDVIAEAYEFGSVTGSLVNLAGETVPDFELVFRNTGSRKPNAVVRTDANGNFDFDAAPAGEFVVASQATPSILVQGLILGAGERLHLPLVLDWGGHEIRGIVLDANDNPVPASRIVLKWTYEAEGLNARTTRRTASDARGYFAFSNLGPGPHSLLIDAPGFPSVDLDHDLNRQGYDLTVRLN